MCRRIYKVDTGRPASTPRSAISCYGLHQHLPTLGISQCNSCEQRIRVRNAIVESLFQLMGAEVRTGATRHPQSQGSVERANRTILGLIRRVLEHSSDWAADIETLLFYYRVRPHSSTGLSPMKAMLDGNVRTSSWRESHLHAQ